MLENNDERNHISIEEIKRALATSKLTDEEVQEVQIALDSFCEILYNNLKN